MEWRAARGRYQVGRVTAVQSLAGEQHVLPAGFAEIEPLQLGFRIVMRMEHVRLILNDQEFDRLCDEGKMRNV